MLSGTQTKLLWAPNVALRNDEYLGRPSDAHRSAQRRRRYGAHLSNAPKTEVCVCVCVCVCVRSHLSALPIGSEQHTICPKTKKLGKNTFRNSK